MQTKTEGSPLPLKLDPDVGACGRLPLSLWALSLAGFVLNLSSTICFGCTPLLMMKVFGMRSVDAGVLEGVVEGFSLVIRAMSGMLSDYLFRRKPFIVVGYGLCAFARFLLAPVTMTEMLIASRFIEKLGNGMQASPREAFISDVVPSSMLGRAFGLNKALSMSGSALGGILMLLLFIHDKNFDIRLLLWIAAVLSLCSFFLICCVKEPVRSEHTKPIVSAKTKLKMIVRDIGDFPSQYWKTLGVICIFKLGYFAGTFLICKLQTCHISFFGIPLYGEKEMATGVFLVIQCVACSFLAYPFGKLSDKMSRRSSVIMGFLFMIVALMLLRTESYGVLLYVGIVLYGLQMSTQGALLALLASTMPQRLHGTGFGVFYCTTGLSIIFTNAVIMKEMSNAYGQDKAFLFISACITVGLCLLLWITRTQKPSVTSPH